MCCALLLSATRQPPTRPVSHHQKYGIPYPSLYAVPGTKADYSPEAAQTAGVSKQVAVWICCTWRLLQPPKSFLWQRNVCGWG